MTAATMNGTARHAAAAAWRQSVTDGMPLTGVQLAEQFGKSARWGRQVIAEARETSPDLVVAAPPDITPERHQEAVGRNEDARPEIAVAVERPAPEVTEEAERKGSWVDSTVTLVVAMVAAAASYGHMYHVASLAGESLWIARAWPVTVDGLAIAALRRGEQGRRWLLLALAVSVASNVLAGYPELVADIAPAVSAWPPLALYGTHRLLHRSA